MSSNISHEIFTIIGAPARLFGRLLLASRYLWNGFSVNAEYARSRYGSSWRWRPWLFFDTYELEIIEDLINSGTDKSVLEFRRNQIKGFQMVSIVGALVASAGLATQQLPGIAQVSYLARACFLITTVLALLATFFTCLQQRAYGFLDNPVAVRAWLADGVITTNQDGQSIFRSSVNSQQLLQAPFELMCISITTFLFGIGTYLGSSLVQHLKVGSEDAGFGNRSVLIAFIVTTSFPLALLGQIVGSRDHENYKCRKLMEDRRVSDVDNLRTNRKDENREDGVPISAVKRTSAPRMGARSLNSVAVNASELISTPDTSNRETVESRGGPTISQPSEELKRALLTAAEAHRAVAAAEAKIAYWYERISETNALDGSSILSTQI